MQAIKFSDHEVVEQPDNSFGGGCTFRCTDCGKAADNPLDLQKLSCK